MPKELNTQQLKIVNKEKTFTTLTTHLLLHFTRNIYIVIMQSYSAPIHGMDRWYGGEKRENQMKIVVE